MNYLTAHSIVNQLSVSDKLKFSEREAIRKILLEAEKVQLKGRESYTADITAARDFRIIATPDFSDYMLQWHIVNGTIVTVTTIRVSREGLAHTLSVIDRVRESLLLAPTNADKDQPT